MPRLSLCFAWPRFDHHHLKTTFWGRIGFVLAGPTLLLSAAAAQDTIPTAVTPLNNTGKLPYSTTIGTPTEQVDLASGNLIVTIPFIQVPGRKMTYDFGIRYDARVWTMTPSVSRAGYYFYNPEMRNWLTPQNLGWTTTQGYLTYSYGKAYCVGVNGEGSTKYWAGGEEGDNYFFSDSSGLKHSLLVNQFRSGECLQSGAGTPYDSSNYVGPDSAMDGFYASFSVPSMTPSAIQDPDGNSYGQGGSSGGASQPSNGLYFLNMGVETDLRGNTQNISAGGVDTIGRTLVTQESSADLINYNVTDTTGTPQTYAVNLENILVTTDFGGVSTIDYSGTRQVVSSVELPNKEAYSFQYDTCDISGTDEITTVTFLKGYFGRCGQQCSDPDRRASDCHPLHLRRPGPVDGKELHERPRQHPRARLRL